MIDLKEMMKMINDSKSKPTYLLKRYKIQNNKLSGELYNGTVIVAGEILNEVYCDEEEDVRFHCIETKNANYELEMPEWDENNLVTEFQ